MLFKLLFVGGGIYLLYRWWSQPAIEAADEEEEYTNYEEVD